MSGYAGKAEQIPFEGEGWQTALSLELISKMSGFRARREAATKRSKHGSM